MKVSEAIWIAMAWAASEVGPISPIRKAAPLKIMHLEGQRRADRQAEPPEGAVARPVGHPEPPEQAKAPEPPVARRRRRPSPASISVEDSVVAMPEPGRPSAGKPRLPNIRHQLAKRVEADRDAARRATP